MALSQNTWELNPWYAQDVAGNAGYSGPGDPGALFMWGQAEQGMLGGPHPLYRSSPTQVGTETTWTQAYVGRASIGTKADGTLWTWGSGTAYGGNLGLNQSSNAEKSSPTQVGTGTDWAAITHCSVLAAAVKTNGTLWAWGRNEFGGLGQNQQDGSNNYKSSPVQVPGTNWSTTTGSIIVGGTGDAAFKAVKTDGTMWCWGNNYDGQLGQGNQTPYSSPVQVGTDTTWSASDGHIGGTGRTNTLAIKTDGTLWAWGRNSIGELGQNNKTEYESPVQIPGTYTYVSKGLNNHDQKSTTFVIKDDSTLWAIGSMWYGTLGNNYGSASMSLASAKYLSSPVQCGGSSTGWATVSHGKLGVLASKTDGTLWAWGYGGDGQLGLNAQLPSGRSSPCQIGTLTNWKIVSSESYANAAIRMPSS